MVSTVPAYIAVPRPLLDSIAPPVRMAQEEAALGSTWGSTAMKCQKCTKAATLHITEVVSEDQFEELHLCEECANKYLYEPQQKGAPKGGESGTADEGEEGSALNQRACPICGIKFVEFRNTGRLGCPHDYQEFRDELVPL